MTTTSVGFDHDIPVILLNGRKIPSPITAYVGPRYLDAFRQAGIQLYTFYGPGIWWIGPDRYDFSSIDSFLSDYTSRIPGGYFMPRIDLSQQGHPWWGELHPDEMNLMLDIESGEVSNQYDHHPRTLHYLGHEVNLETTNLHSFYSLAWREEAGRAVSALVAHCEAQSYAEQIWAGTCVMDYFASGFTGTNIHSRASPITPPRRSRVSTSGCKQPTREILAFWPTHGVALSILRASRSPLQPNGCAPRTATFWTPSWTVPQPTTTNLSPTRWLIVS